MTTSVTVPTRVASWPMRALIWAMSVASMAAPATGAVAGVMAAGAAVGVVGVVGAAAAGVVGGAGVAAGAETVAGAGAEAVPRPRNSMSLARLRSERLARGTGCSRPSLRMKVTWPGTTVLTEASNMAPWLVTHVSMVCAERVPRVRQRATSVRGDFDMRR